MFALIRSVAVHWRSSIPSVQADAVVEVLRPVILTWCRLSPLTALIAVVAFWWRLARG